MAAHSQYSAWIGKEIRSWRKYLRFTQDELARSCGMSRNCIAMLERGESNPTLNTIVRIFDVLGLDLGIEERET